MSTEIDRVWEPESHIGRSAGDGKTHSATWRCS